MQQNTDRSNRENDKLTKEEIKKIKIKKEIEKLDYEIKEKKQKWLKKNIVSLLPSIIGVGTLIIVYLTGYFNVEGIRLKNERSVLLAEIKDFTDRKDSLNRRNIKLQAENDSLHRDSDRLIAEIALERKRTEKQKQENKLIEETLKRDTNYQRSIFKQLGETKDKELKDCHKQLNYAVNKQIELESKASKFDDLNQWIQFDIMRSGDAQDGTTYWKSRLKAVRDSLLNCRFGSHK